ncbi:MAG: hypothetical protein KatS3mg003_1505 [Candidatus Nitrosocaldaceae archaeon]|nr:MAG: hypothetical protein KatS3mg003_1505 [Candidatus Nitrosocaldaceae archaeon]
MLGSIKISVSPQSKICNNSYTTFLCFTVRIIMMYKKLSIKFQASMLSILLIISNVNMIITAESAGNISGYIFIDNNLNGIMDASEVGKFDWSITLSGNAVNGSSITLTTRSNAMGYYSFFVPDGNYQVTIHTVNNWGNTTPKSVNVIINSSSNTINFGIVKLGQIKAIAFADKNQNGIKDSNESFIAWTFQLTGTLNNGTTINNTLSGNPTKFTNLYPGGYSIKVLENNGYDFTTTNNINITINGSNHQLLFGVVKLADIQGYIYNDTNSNGARNVGESLLSNWQVFLYKDDELIDSTYSNASGFFSFKVKPGTYKLSVSSNGYVFTQPSNGEYIIEINSIGRVTKHFGLTKNFDILNGLGDIVAFHAFDIVIDSSNRLLLNFDNLIKRFDINGTLLDEYNTPTTYLAIGGIAIDKYNNIIFTVDNKIIKLFNTGQLALLAQFNATQNYPNLSGIDVDSNNNIYVTSKLEHKIFVLDENGSLIKTIGSPGFSEGFLRLPFDVVVDSQGRVIVANTGNNRVEIFDNNGNFIKSIGGFGDTNGKLNKPRGVAVDDADNIYVADTYNARIQVFDKNGNFLRSFGSLGSDPGEFGNPSGVFVDNNGMIYVYDLTNDRVSIHNNNGEYVREFKFVDSYIEPYFVYVDNGLAYISDGHRHKVIIINASTGEFIDEFGGFGVLQGEFRGPRGITIVDDEIYVADNYNARIQVFDKNGNFLRSFGSFGSGTTDLNQPRGLVSFNNILYIADTKNDRIKITDTNGNLINNIESITPYQIAVDNDGNIYAAEFSLDRITKYDMNGNVIMQINNLTLVKGVYVDSYYNIYAGVSNENKIKKFDSNGNLLLEFGSGGINEGSFLNMRGIFVDDDNRIWVADGDAHRVQVFDNAGVLLMVIDYESLFN